MREIRNKTANSWGRALIIAVALVLTLGPMYSQTNFLLYAATFFKESKNDNVGIIWR